MAYETLLTETRGRVGLITLNRPQQLNALNDQLIGELNVALDGYEADDGIGAIVVTGSEKAFAAGADIKEMQAKTYIEAYKGDFIASWERITRCRKPVIAAVARLRARRRMRAGHELRFHHRGRHRQVRPARDQARHHAGRRRHAAAGARGRKIEGDGALPHGAHDGCGGGRAGGAGGARGAGGRPARRMPSRRPTTIASMSLTAAMMTKDCVNRAFETTLAEGIRYERRTFHALFATHDQKEGMAAFIEKRRPLVPERMMRVCVTADITQSAKIATPPHRNTSLAAQSPLAVASLPVPIM